MVSTDESEVPNYPDLLRLDDRGFIVLGAGVGIGRQAAHALASVGARVFCIDNVESLAQDVADEVGGVPWVADARKREDVEGAVAAAEKELGRIHGAVDIVGMARYTSLLETTDDDWEWTFDMVLRHAHLAAQVGGRAMTASGGGVLVFVASVSGLSAAPVPNVLIVSR